MIKQFYQPEYMLRKHTKFGELPSAKEAYGRMFKMALPSTIEALLGGLTSFVDMIMVSSVGITAVTAVGITTQPRMIILMLFMALNTGVTALIARRKGEDDAKKANEVLMQALLICFVLAIIMTTIGMVTARPLLRFAGAGADFIEDSIIYYRIITAGTVFGVLTMTINAAQRGAGNTKIAMTTSLISNVVNVVFNFLLIKGRLGFPALGVKGAAIATVIGMVAAFLAACYSLRNASFIYFDIEGLKKFDPEIVKSIANISGNAAFEELCFRFGFFMYNKIVAELGTIDYGTHLVCMQIMNLSTYIGAGLGIGTTALVGQTLGEKRSDLSMLYIKIGRRMAIIVSVVLSALFIFGGKMLMGLFTDDPVIIENGRNILLIMALSSFCINTQIVHSGSLRGAGDVKFVATMALISVAVIRPLFSYILVYPLQLGLIGAWLGLLADQFVRSFSGMLRIRRGKWATIHI